MDEALLYQLHRLFLNADGGVCDTAGQTRVLALDLPRGEDWQAGAALLAALRDDFALPTPVVSIGARGGYRLWFALAEPVLLGVGRDWLAALVRRYLADLPAVGLWPASVDDTLPPVPACDPASGRWSAFIDPSLGSMFAEEPGLEMAPPESRQAELLAGFACIEAADFRRVAASLAASAVEPLVETAAQAVPAGAWQHVGTHYTEPRAFLLAVMNDPTASPEHRLRAAEALLAAGD